MTVWYAQTAGGNWNSGVMWNDQAGGGGSFGTPGDGDTCNLNGKTVVMNIATIPASGTLALLTGAGSSCRLTLAMSGSTNYAINATTITPGNTVSTAFIEVTGGSASGTLTVTGNLVGTGGGNSPILYGSTTGNITINGNVTAGTGVGAWRDTGLLTINGNVLAAAGAGCLVQGTGRVAITGNITSAGSFGMNYSSTGISTVVGNVSSVGASASAWGIQQTGGTLTITGNVTAGSAAVGVYKTAGTMTVNGNVTGGSGAVIYGMWLDGSGATTINGTVTGGTHRTGYGIHNIVTGTLTINGNLIFSSTTTAPVTGPFFYNPASGNYSQFTATGPSTFKQYREDAFVTAAQVQTGVTFWAEGASGTGTYTPGGYPSINDVRFGVVFGASSEYTGTVSIPAVGNVLQGVGFGSGGGTEFTGTYVVTAAADVQSGVAFGAAGAQTGTFVAPAQSDVRQGVGYGAAGAEYTGSLGGGVVTLTAV